MIRTSVFFYGFVCGVLFAIIAGACAFFLWVRNDHTPDQRVVDPNTRPEDYP